MKKILNFFLSVLAILATIGFLNCIINYFFLWENNGAKYYKKYIENSTQIRIKADEKGIEDKFGYTHYLKYTIYYKGITGGSEDQLFRDVYTKRYFKIMRFDLKNSSTAAVQSTEVDGREMLIMVNNEEINNPDYGSITNPIHIFSYKSVGMPIQTWWQGESGKTIFKNLEPTQKEYENNVIQYLTYVMSGKEFKERFEK